MHSENVLYSDGVVPTQGCTLYLARSVKVDYILSEKNYIRKDSTLTLNGTSVLGKLYDNSWKIFSNHIMLKITMTFINE